ncbi:MAG: hypothetical protein ACHRHE_15660 [Tepidisphaerales bacterium]
MFSISPYAISRKPEGFLGAYGGVLLKPLLLRVGGWREGESLLPGTIVPREVTSEWPLTNRLALANNSFIRYFQTEEEAEGMAPVLAEQVQSSPAHAIADAEDQRDGVASRRTLQLAAARASKALKAAAQRQSIEA